MSERRFCADSARPVILSAVAATWLLGGMGKNVSFETLEVAVNVGHHLVARLSEQTTSREATPQHHATYDRNRKLVRLRAINGVCFERLGI